MSGYYFSAIVIAIVEGLTEFLPVSSTGHMILVSSLLDFNFRGHESFEIFIQLGAILAIVVLYPHRFTGLIPESTKINLKEGGFKGFRGLALLAVGCFPAFVLGALFHSSIKAVLFKPWPVALALIVGGVALIVADRIKVGERVASVDELSFGDVLKIGLAQCCALWPGVSRSGSTIVGALLLGVQREAAAEFSFLLAVPVMCAAVSYDLYKSSAELSWDLLPLFGLGFVVAFLVAIVAVKGFVALLNRLGLEPFGYYRILLGAVVLLPSLWG